MAEATGLGTKFQREKDSPAVGFDDIASVVSITPPQLTRETVDVEELAPTDDMKRKLVGLIDGGDFTVTVNYDPEDATQKLLETDLANGVEVTYRIQFPYDDALYSGGGYCEINGIVTGFAPQEIASGEVMQAEITFAVTSKPDYVELVEIEGGGS